MIRTALFASFLLLGPALRAQDPPLAAARGQLLSIAFSAASALPVHPHGKTRERLQEEVVTEALALQQAGVAAAMIERMDGWRQGMCLAALAELQAQRGGGDPARELLARAGALADKVLEDPNQQAWRRDRVRARIAAVYDLLGDHEQAVAFGTGLVDNEAATALGRSAAFVARADFDACLARLDELVHKGEFEPVRGALLACAELYDRFFAEAECRAAAAQRVQFGYEKLPVQLRLALVERLVTAALAHGDQAEALRLTAFMRECHAAANWLPAERIAHGAHIAALRGRAGAVAEARGDLEALAKDYAEARTQIVDIERADAVRPLAEGRAVLGDRDAALELYGLAVAEGALNPNARPRAEDLVATCLAMVRADFAPDAALLRRIESVRDGLRDPW